MAERGAETVTEMVTDQVTALVADLAGPDGATLDGRLAAMPLERALEVGLFLARCEPGLAREAARAVAARIYAALRPLAAETLKLADDLAQLALALGLADDAVALLMGRLERSASLGAYQLLGRAYIALHDDQRGRDLAARLRDEAGSRVTGWLAAGELALAFEDVAAAIATYRQALAVSPASSSARMGLAHALAAAGDAEGARAEVARVFAVYGDAPSVWVLREARAVATALDDALDDDWGVELRERLAGREASEAERLRVSLAAAPAGTAMSAPDAAHTRRRTLGATLGALSVAEARGDAASDVDGDGDSDSDGSPDADDDETAAPQLVEALRDTFGYESFLPGQATIVQAVLAGEDVLALMPTGAGKSLCYQLPAALLPGTTVLISPLIALMKDQVEGLPAELRAQTTVINSLVARDELERRLADIAAGRYKLVYAAPERLRQQPFLYALRCAGVARFVVDEAHCVSLWGHDFRPDYLFIAKALRRLQAGRARVPVLAVTATATPEVRAGIAEALGRDLRVVNRGVFRPNLRYDVVRAGNNEERLRALEQIVTQTPGSAIVYVRSRDGCEAVAEFLRRRCQVAAVHYHAGMERAAREAAQDAFIAGRARVVVATVAFGMGIDKPDVRTIVHYQLPGSLEAYVQESGRAGRDGKPARCVLFVSPSDANAVRRHIRQDELSIETLRAVYAAARGLVRLHAPSDTNLARVASVELERALATALEADGHQADETGSRVALSLLERAGFLLRHPDVPRTPAARIRRQTPPAAKEQALRAFIEAADLGAEQSRTLDLVALAARLGTSPADLEETLLGWRDAGLIEYRDGARDLLLEICPPPPGGREALPALLAQLAERHERQIETLLAYTRSQQCRQTVIARHFGERLSAAGCGTCDRCRPAPSPGAAGATGASGTALATRQARVPRTRDDATVRAALVACLGELPYAVGISGLVKILRGSTDVGPAGKRSPQYGALAGVGEARLTRTIGALLAEGALERDASAEYPTLRLAETLRED